MFCTKCGKELYEGDRFCAFCGAEVRSHNASKNEEVVFNPPFKIEAKKKTEEILKATEERKKEEEKEKTKTVTFDWNLEGFPTERPKKTEDVDFNWDSVLERRTKFGREQAAEPVQPAQTVQVQQDGKDEPEIEKIEPTIPDADIHRSKHDESVMSVEELEKDLFGDGSFEPDDRFHTFNRKNSEFQELLDKEKKRMQSLEDEYNRQLAEMDYTWVPEVFPLSKRQAEPETQEIKPEPVPEIKPEPVPEIEPEPISEPVLMGVVQPGTPLTVDLTGETPCTPCEKDKLRYSDIFPRVDVTGGDNNSDAILANVEEEEPVKKHTALKVIIAILILALVTEGAILGIKFIAPESKASQMINNAIFKAADIFRRGNEPPQNEEPTSQTEIREVYISNIVAEKAAEAKTIGSVIYNPELVYDNSKSYSFEEISSADEFVDAEWQGMSATYGEKLIETIIKYYDGWRDINKDKSLVGINTLEIGEIRTGQTGFYTLCRVTYAGKDGSETTKTQTVYTVISNELMVINEIKEEVL